MGIRAVRSALSRRGGAISQRYIIVVTLANLLWEIAQLPLSVIWSTARRGEIAFAVAHCTFGDILIAASAFLLAILVVGNEWPKGPRLKMCVVTALLGASYTIFSEWINVSVRGSWAYASAMPIVPPFGTGLTPLLQWLIIPPLAICYARRPDSRARP